MYGYRPDRGVLERFFALDDRGRARGSGIIWGKPTEFLDFRFERQRFFKFPLYVVDYLWIMSRPAILFVVLGSNLGSRRERIRRLGPSGCDAHRQKDAGGENKWLTILKSSWAASNQPASVAC
jgi:hypothetical protein